MKTIIASLALMLASFSALADTVYVQGQPQLCQWQNVFNPQTGTTAPAWVCQQYMPPPTVIYSSPPTQTIIVEHDRTPWYVPFAAGVGTALILRGGEHHHGHR